MVETILGIGASLCYGAISLRLVDSHTPDTPWFRRILDASIGTAAVAFLLYTVLQLSPVVVDMKAQVLSRTDGQVVVSVSSEKVRKKCEFLGSQTYTRPYGGMYQKAWLEYLKDPSPGSTRPVGKQSFGDWRIIFSDSVMRQDELLIVSHHDCGNLLGLTTTETGPFVISP